MVEIGNVNVSSKDQSKLSSVYESFIAPNKQNTHRLHQNNLPSDSVYIYYNVLQQRLKYMLMNITLRFNQNCCRLVGL